MSRAVLQMLNVLASVGLGHFGNAFTFGAAVAAAAFGALWASWREDTHLLWLEPGTRTFAVCAMLYWLLYGTAYALWEDTRIAAPLDDDVLEDYDHPFQPWPIVFDGVLKPFLICFVTFSQRRSGISKEAAHDGGVAVMCHVGVAHHSTRRSEEAKRGAGVV